MTEIKMSSAGSEFELATENEEVCLSDSKFSTLKVEELYGGTPLWGTLCWARLQVLLYSSEGLSAWKH
jgi:hypothetical protein